MDILTAVVLALVQGLTEFLPVSSSAHLILVPRFLGWDDQGLAFDVAVHCGTLLAVLWYFRRDVGEILVAWFASLARRPHDSAAARLGWAVILATIPVGLAGLLFHDFISTELRSPRVIAIATAVFGIVLWLADRAGRRRLDEHAIGPALALMIGAAQAIALVPGTSRSGITITAGLLLGLTREAAARFSFLMSIPVITLATGRETVELVSAPVPADWAALATGLIVAALSAYVCIRVFLAAIGRIGMLPFALYRLVLAAAIFAAFS